MQKYVSKWQSNLLLLYVYHPSKTPTQYIKRYSTYRKLKIYYNIYLHCNCAIFPDFLHCVRYDVPD